LKYTKQTIQIMKKTTTILMALAATTALGQAAIIAFEAESGSMGSGWDTVADNKANGGNYIVSNPNQTGDAPADEANVTEFSVTLVAGTYNLYARVLVDSVNQSGTDSIFIGDGFGAKTVATPDEWIKVNDMQAGANTYVDADGAEIENGVYNWVKLSGQVTTDESVPQFTSSGATETFQIGTREVMRIDSFAFVTDGETPNSAQLTAALVPEPSSAALLGLGGLALIFRRRK
jgi:hypothetical protein